MTTPHQSEAPFVGERVFQNRGVCGQASPSFPSPTPYLPPFCSRPNFRASRMRKTNTRCPNFVRFVRERLQAFPYEANEVSHFEPRGKWGESKKVEGRGWGRGKKGTLARKPLNFEKRPLVFTVEFILNWSTTLSPNWNHNGATCIYKLVWRAISRMFVLEPAFPMV